MRNPPEYSVVMGFAKTPYRSAVKRVLRKNTVKWAPKDLFEGFDEEESPVMPLDKKDYNNMLESGEFIDQYVPPLGIHMLLLKHAAKLPDLGLWSGPERLEIVDTLPELNIN